MVPELISPAPDEVKALFIGETLMELVTKGGVSEEFVGGSPANIAVGLARLGQRAHLLTCVGHDPEGERVAAFLANESVELLPASWVSFPTPTVHATIDDDGQPSYDFSMQWAVEDPGADDFDLVHAGSIGLFLEPGGSRVLELLERFSGRSIISIDPNVRPALLSDHGVAVRRFEQAAALADILKLSDEDVEWLYPGTTPAQALRRIHALGTSIVVVTMGAEGAIAFNGEDVIRVAAFATEVVDTISAGDSFMASLISTLLERGVELTRSEIEQMLRRAASAAAIAVSVAGPNPPTREALDGFVRDLRG